MIARGRCLETQLAVAIDSMQAVAAKAAAATLAARLAEQEAAGRAALAAAAADKAAAFAELEQVHAALSRSTYTGCLCKHCACPTYQVGSS